MRTRLLSTRWLRTSVLALASSFALAACGGGSPVDPDAGTLLRSNGAQVRDGGQAMQRNGDQMNANGRSMVDAGQQMAAQGRTMTGSGQAMMETGTGMMGSREVPRSGGW